MCGFAPGNRTCSLTLPTDKLLGFFIAGADKNWVPAEAKIDGDTVLVSSPQVAQPVAVRYGWANVPQINLYNKEGLPASPFRTRPSPLRQRLLRHRPNRDSVHAHHFIYAHFNSITDSWPRVGEWSWLKFAPYKPADFGISGERTEGMLGRIDHGELDGIHPKVVVLMMGTNNVGGAGDEMPEWTAAAITKIVETIHQKIPATKVLLLGIFPRYGKESPLREKVAAVNRIISKLDDGEKTRYLDIGKIFLDADNNIPKEIMPDGLHPSAKGYDLWYEAMNPLLTEMMR